MRTKTILLLFLAGFLSLPVLLSPVRSLFLSPIPPPSLKVSPVVIETTIAPGGSYARDIKVTNETDQFLPIRITPLTWDAEDLSGDPFFTPEEERDWLMLSETDFILEPGEERKIELSVAVPKNTEPGGHYPALSFRPVLPTSIDLGVATETEIIALLFITVPGEIKTEIRIEKFAPTRRVFYNRGPTFDLTLENLGNVHTRATGTITASPALPLARPLLSISSSLPAPLRVLSGKRRQFELESQPPRWLPGRYRASLSLSPTESPSAKLEPPIATAETGFWYIPNLVPPLLFLALLALALGTLRVRKRIIPAVKVLVKG